MIPILPVPKRYAWGSLDRLQTMFGDGDTSVTQGSGPLAEMWFSAHEQLPGGTPMASDALIREESCGQGEEKSRSAEGDRNIGVRRVALPDLLKQNPEGLLGRVASRQWGPMLPYLLKVIAVREPLSLQVHPLDFEARRGFHREEDAGVPLQAPDRSFRDTRGKHEMVVALEPFAASVGFAPIARQIRALRSVTHPLPQRMADILESGEPSTPRIDAMMPESARVWSQTARRVFRAFALAASYGGDIGTVGLLDAAAGCVEGNAERLMLSNAMRAAQSFPADASALCLLMMNPVRLRKGESISIAPGTPHVYLHGLAAEIMTNSDNVLRAGLTVKYRDLPNLLRSLNAMPTPPAAPYVVGDRAFGIAGRLGGDRVVGGLLGGGRVVGGGYADEGVERAGMALYHPCVDEFSLIYGHVDGGRVAEWPLPMLAQDRPRIVVCVKGAVQCRTERPGGITDAVLTCGKAMFVPASDGLLRVVGYEKTGGDILLASTGI
ncbi:mannose-6-phosphate isomerase [Bifidobacterium margollesii]|uniref:Mannose-6-phosphate isomerase n=2 Tax=Bifidobacterium margollesii TaxID=2020964 RepID=A0A2N5J8W1_9BIFI|nr:mannose-6-phosphate isomerase [Bifidobacterium margollesii]